MIPPSTAPTSGVFGVEETGSADDVAVEVWDVAKNTEETDIDTEAEVLIDEATIGVEVGLGIGEYGSLSAWFSERRAPISWSFGQPLIWHGFVRQLQLSC